MNYLGHALLSFGRPQILAGNMIGDYVKGSVILDSFPEEIKQGIILHRKIDAFADSHPATLRAKNLFRPDYRLYAGAFVDSLYDHFLANDPRYFPGETDLRSFSETVYAQLDSNKSYLPERFLKMLPYMVSDNWLYNYRHDQNIKFSMRNVLNKAKYLDKDIPVFEAFLDNKDILQKCYDDFFPDLMAHAKAENALLQLRKKS